MSNTALFPNTTSPTFPAAEVGVCAQGPISNRWPAAKINKSAIVDPFVEGSTRYYAKSTIFWLYLSFLVGVFGVLQTQWFVAFTNRPDYTQIRKDIQESKRLQDQLAREYGLRSGSTPSAGIEIHRDLFNTPQTEEIEGQLRFLLQDDLLQSDLKRAFGYDFRDINAVVFPGWLIYESVSEQAGLTPQGELSVLRSSGSSTSLGFTLRDQPEQQRLTIDGRPRIALNVGAFKTRETLRFALFHELFHAMNVPGISPSRFTFAQNDLTYLTEYRSYLWRSGLEGNRQYLIWLLIVIIPWTISLFCILRLVNLRRAKRESDKMLSGYLSS